MARFLPPFFSRDVLFDTLLPLLVVIVIVISGIITTWFGGFGSSQHATFLCPLLVITTIIALFANAPHLLLVISSLSSLESSAGLVALAAATTEIRDLLSSPLWS
jgi:hypothetical protein